MNAMLPYLMRYMGHSDIKNTLYYFHLVPDIYGGILDRSSHSERLIPEVDDGCKILVILRIGRVHGCHPGFCLEQNDMQPGCPMRRDQIF